MIIETTLLALGIVASSFLTVLTLMIVVGGIRRC